RVSTTPPPRAPRPMVSLLGIPRPTYMAAHGPAGPAPTMITSYPLVVRSVMRPPFQSRGLSLPRQCARQSRAKYRGFELDVGPLRARQLLERGGADRSHAVLIPVFLV